MPPAGDQDLPVIFGTDGVRDRAGSGLLAPDAVARIVSATALILRERAGFPAEFPDPGARSIVLGRDTRESGQDLARLVARAFSRHGHEVHDIGVLPTPGVARVASSWPDTALGVMISASHNPAEWNGIKFLAPTGAKISPQFERAVSDAFHASPAAGGISPGEGGEARIFDRGEEAFEAYVTWLVGSCRKPERLRGRTVALDPANGAAHRVAPEVFRRLGARVVSRGHEPDGKNINLDAGALHPDRLAALAAASGAALGFSFDGDADRMIPITGGGEVLDGDHVLFVAGRHYSRAGKLPRRAVVATVMSNLGLEIALRNEGISLIRTDVGDRHVYLAMVDGGHPLGGEQSGHIIFFDHSRTGDGVLAAVRLADMLESDSLDLGSEAAEMRRYPQVLKNVRVPDRRPFESLDGVMERLAEAERRLGSEGRVLLRYSGTELLARVMLEGPDQASIEALAAGICDAIRRGFGSVGPVP